MQLLIYFYEIAFRNVNQHHVEYLIFDDRTELHCGKMVKTLLLKSQETKHKYQVVKWSVHHDLWPGDGKCRGTSQSQHHQLVSSKSHTLTVVYMVELIKIFKSLTRNFNCTQSTLHTNRICILIAPVCCVCVRICK